ncbi:MAG TPA: tetratricopeptide repeat protein [Bacteroidia bacterium]|nr:tetratricopeptide repeat protein [Bacteroidia bacterium]
MKFISKKRIYFGIIFAMISLLFLSCSSSKKSVSSKDAKKHGQFDEDKFKAVFYDGLKQKILGNYDDAIVLFRKSLAINPASPAANFEVAEIMEFNKRPDSSLIYITRAVNGDPGNIWYKYFYAQNLQDLGRLKDVIKVYDDLAKAHPGNTDLYYKLALAQIQAGEYKEAIGTYDVLEQKLGSPDEDLAMSKIEILEKIKDYARAEEEIQKLIKNDPSAPQYHDMLGNLYDMEGKSDKAFEEYKKMEEIHPNDPMVHLSLADYYKTRNQDQKAFEELAKAFDEPSLDVDTKIRIIMGLSTFTTTDTIFSEAMTLSQKMVNANPTEPRAHAIYAGLLMQYKKDFTGARDQYRLAVSEDSSRYTYWGQLLDLEAKLNNIKDLEIESRKAIELFPTNAQLYYYNGFANLQLKNFEAALNSFKSGVFYVLNDSNLLGLFYTYIGNVNYYVRHFPASDSAYDEALRINPDNDNALNDYSYFLSVRDTDLVRAEKMSKRANELDTANDAYEDTYAWIFYMSGKYQDAKQWESKAIQNGGTKDATILEHYGDILYKLGEKDLALEYWVKAKDKGAGSDLLEKKIKDKKLYEK